MTDLMFWPLDRWIIITGYLIQECRRHTVLYYRILLYQKMFAVYVRKSRVTALIGISFWGGPSHPIKSPPVFDDPEFGVYHLIVNHPMGF